jgi:MFS family permease
VIDQPAGEAAALADREAAARAAMPRVATRTILVLNAYWMGLAFMWNSLHIIILPAVLLNFVPASQKNGSLGLLTFFGLALALVVQPLAGALSDRWSSRWGRRRPLMLAGTLVDFVFLALLGGAGGFWWLFIGYIGLQISSNTAQGPLQGLLPDRVPPTQLGMASGLKNIADMAGLVLASLVIGRLVPPDVKQPTAGILVVALMLAACASITIGKAGEASTAGQYGAQPGLLTLMRDAFTLDLRGQAGYWWLIGSRMLFLFGIYGIQIFAQYFVRDRLAVPNPVRTTGDLLGAIVLALMACAAGAGWLCDHWGRRPVQAIAGGLGAVGAILLTGVHTPQQLLVAGAILGAGIGLFMTANWALANELAPMGEAGKFLGLANLATAGAGALGRLEGPLIDAANNARPGAWLGYTYLFGLGAVCIVASTALLVKVPERRKV